MQRRLAALIVAAFLLLSGSLVRAGGKAEITFLERSPGVGAKAHMYSPPGKGGRSPGSTSGAPSSGVAEPSLGPAVVVPLAGQVICGHDPAVPGGLTCALPPPERPRLSRIRQRPAPPSPEQIGRLLADRAIALAPKPELRLAPRRRGLTGLDSYFWLARRPRPIQARARAGAMLVIAEARPVQYVWDFGDGNDRVTRKSGRRWTRKRPGNISHMYEGKGRYELGVEVIWEARWRTTFGGWRPLGYFSTDDSRGYRVREIFPVLEKPD